MSAAQALQKAIKEAGGVVALARELGISHPAILNWRQTPPLRVLAVEKATGVSRHELRPDIYPRDDWEPKIAEAKTLLASLRGAREKKREKV